MEVKRSGHGVYTLSYHVVWVTKYRRKILNPGIVEYLRRVLPQLVRSMPGVELEQMGFDEDHAHFVIGIPPKYAIADVMGELKNRSASLIREKFDFLKKVYWREKIVWSPGYFVSSIGINKSIVMNYVKWQGAQDSDQLRMEL